MLLSSTAFLGAISDGFIYSFVAFSIYISFRLLDFPDLTVEGSFPLGAAVSAALIVSGWNPWLSIFVAILAGMLAGMVTGILNVYLKILHLLASILVMYGLYSINLRIMGQPNLSIYNEPSILQFFYDFSDKILVYFDFQNILSEEGYQLLSQWASNLVPVIVFLVVLFIVFILLWFFLRSEVGLAMRATGANPIMARSQGIRTKLMIILGIAIANGLVALAGALFAQSSSSADANLGVGVLIGGLAALIGGEALLSPKSIFRALIACILGSIAFKLVIALALNTNSLNFKPGDTRIITAILMLVAIKFQSIKSWIYSVIKQLKSWIHSLKKDLTRAK